MRRSRGAGLPARGRGSVDSPWVTQFFLGLRRTRETVRVQVHTHPHEAGHSGTDDQFSLVPAAGFLSLVIPAFGGREILPAAGVHDLKRKERPGLKRWRTLRDALRDIPEPANGRETPGWPNHSGIPGERIYKKHTGSPVDWPSKTINAGVHGVCGGEAMIRFPDGSLRYLTIREAAFLQGFPHNYEFPGSRSRVMGVIGNAVAVPVAEILGRSLIAHLNLELRGSVARRRGRDRGNSGMGVLVQQREASLRLQ